MARREAPLFVAIDPRTVVSGLAYDAHPLAIPLWEELENVDIMAGQLQRIKGWSQLASLGLSNPRGLGQLVSSAGVKRVYAGDTTKLVGYDFSTVTTTSGFTGATNETLTAPATGWSFTDWGDWMLATNGVDPAQIAKNSLSFSALSGTTFTRAQIFLKFATFILAINTNNRPDGGEWCNQNNPEDWVSGTGKTAGAFRIRELQGGLIAAAPLGSEFALYGANQMFRLGFRGSPNWFGYQAGPSGIGAVGKHAVCSDGLRNYGISRRGLWESDGLSYQYIDLLEGRELREELQNIVNWSQASKCVVRRNDLANAIEFSMPINGSGEPNVIYRFDLNRRSFTKLPQARTSMLERLVATNPLSLTPGGILLLDDFGTSADGGSLNALLRTRPLMLGTPHQEAYLDQLQFLAKNPGSLEWRVRAFRNFDDAASWTPWEAITANMETSIQRLNGTYFQLEFRSTGANDAWKFAGFLLYGTGDGLDRGRDT